MTVGAQDNLGEAKVAIRATLEKLDGDLKEARGRVEGAMAGIQKVAGQVGQNMQSLGKIALGGIGALGGVLTGAAAGMAALAASAEPLIGLEAGFASVTSRLGKSSEEMLSSLRDASGGLITNRDLMQSFNTAAALVGDEFAETLPDAMSLVRRASQATGQDMGFLFDSLVKGVGRVSPMILDNLGIQVSLAEVTEHAAQMFGKSAEELSKQEQQAALSALMMDKLNEKYGEVPDVPMTFAQIKTSITNLKDEIGKKLLPVFQPLIGKFLELAEKALPPLMDILDTKILPVLQAVGDAIGGFIDGLIAGENPIDNVSQLMADLGAAIGLNSEDIEDLVSGFQGIAEGVQNVIDTVKPYLEQAWEWITQNVELKDVLAGLAIVIASVVLPAIWGVISAALPLVATFAGIVAVVALLRNAWENDWGGIRTTLTEFWENTAKPALEKLAEWLADNIPVAIAWLKDAWENVLLPAIKNVWNWIETNLIPLFLKLSDWLSNAIPTAIETLRSFWEDKLLPAINAVWSFIDTYLVPIFQDIIDIAGRVIELAITAMQGAWENVLLPAIEAVWGFIDEHLLPIFEDIREFIENKLGPVVRWLADDVFTPLANTLEGGVKRALEWLHEKLEAIKGFLDNFKLPDWLTPGSPTPFELGLRGINSALDQLSRHALPAFSAELQLEPVGIAAITAAGNRGGGSTTYNNTYNFYGLPDSNRAVDRIRAINLLTNG